MMGRIVIQDIATMLVERHGLGKKEASAFLNAVFDIVQQALERDRVVKLKGLGVFKIIDVDARESVNVNTGERVLIEGHQKITFTPDALMKELVNKPFSQFETVVLNEGVDFEDVLPGKEDNSTAEAVVSTPANLVAETAIPESVDDTIDPQADTDEPKEEAERQMETETVEEILDEEIPEWVIEPYLSEEKSPAEKEEVSIDEGSTQEVRGADAGEKTSQVVGEEKKSIEEKEEIIEEKIEETGTVCGDVNVAEEAAEEEIEEVVETSNSKKWLIPVVACLGGLIGGYFFGSYFPASEYLSVFVDDTKKESVAKSVKGNRPMASTSAYPQEEVKKSAEEKVEPQVLAVEKKQPVSESKPVEEKKKLLEEKSTKPKPESSAVVDKSSERELDRYEAMDARVRTGAYRIVGTNQVIKVRQGDNISKISRRTLGPDMECYMEVYNGLKATTELKVGQEIKIPKLELKKKKKPQTAS